MRLMDKYVLREYLISLAYCFSAFAMVYVLLDLFGHLAYFIRARTALVWILRYYVFWILPFLEYLLPASLLFATLYTLWRMTRNNELTAMRTSGVSLYRVMFPFLGVGLFCSVAILGIKEFLVPLTNPIVQEFRDGKFSGKKPGGPAYVQAYFKDTPSRQLWEVARLDPLHPRLLIGVKITEERMDGTKAREIVASRAEWLDGAWWLFKASVQKYNPDEFQTPKGPPIQLSPAGVELTFLKARPGDIASEVKPVEDLSSLEISRYLAARPDLPHHAQQPTEVNLQYRLAIPWACLIVTLFGIPVGAHHARHNILATLFVALGCFFGFFALLETGLFMAKKQMLSPWLGAWSSNIVFFVAGLVMTRKLR